MSVLTIEIISSSQNIPSMLDKAKLLVDDSGIGTVWTVEPYGRSVFLIHRDGKALFHEEMVESEGIRVDFARVFSP